MNVDEINTLFAPLYEDRLDNIAVMSKQERPSFLAHYTSLDVLEKIIKNNELWFSNPLNMNDYQELQFGFYNGRDLFHEVRKEPETLNMCDSPERLDLIVHWFNAYFNDYEKNHILDVFVFCLSEHKKDQPNGLLSMWRGYGQDGNGAALIFNTSFLTVKHESPLIFAKVFYGSEQERFDNMKETFRKCFSLISDKIIENEHLYIVGYHLFYLMLCQSLLSKHQGFKEEEEWRIIYLLDRDPPRPDPDLPNEKGKTLLKNNIFHFVNGNSIETKLRFPIKPLKLEPRQEWTFESILENIILGPVHNNRYSVHAVKIMLDCLGKPEFKSKVWHSETPYRPAK